MARAFVESTGTTAATAPPVVQVEGLTKRFGSCTALDGVFFEVQRGEIVGILGPNGAGKTTLMRILAGFLPASQGDAHIGGRSVLTDSTELRKRIGYLPETAPLYADMRVNEYLRYRAGLKGLSGQKAAQATDESLKRCGLKDVQKRIIGSLSKGYRQRVGLADALLNSPDLLILDEPTAGLDPNQIRQVRETIRDLAEQHTILLSTHILPEVEMTCSRVLILNQGSIVASDTPDGLRQWLRGAVELIVEMQGDAEAASAQLAERPGVGRIRVEVAGDWTRLVLECRPGCDLREDVFAMVSTHGWRLRELRVEHKSLEDVFVAVTQHETGGGVL